MRMSSESGEGKLQSHVISAMGLVQSPIRTAHQPPLGIINHLGRKASMSAKPHICIDSQFLCQVAFSSLSFDKVSTMANHSLWHSKMKNSCRMPWMACLLNIQMCARCRDPNMKYLCLRVTQSRADEIFRSLPRVTQIFSRRRQNFCRPRFYGPDLNIR